MGSGNRTVTYAPVLVMLLSTLTRVNAAMSSDVDYRIPIIGEKAPSFTAATTQGMIKFPDDYKGSWVILFSHPADFTPCWHDGIHDICLHGEGIQRAEL